MTTRTVRVTRTWDVPVEAEYGDDYASLCAKVAEDHLDDTTPDADHRVVLEEHESPVAKWWERDEWVGMEPVARAAEAERVGYLARFKEWASAAHREDED